jgi:hypothetical protein
MRETNKVSNKTALLITSGVSLDRTNSGASKRLDTLNSILRIAGFSVTIIPEHEFYDLSEGLLYDLAVVYGTSRPSVIRSAKRQSLYVWYDACDSQTLLKCSLIVSGRLREAIALVKSTLDHLIMPTLDIVTFISENDKNWEISLNLATKKCFVISNILKTQELIGGESNRIVFVGDGQYLPNRLAIEFIEKIADELSKDIKIMIFGRGLYSSHPQIVTKGYVEAQELYKFGDIHLAPIKVGTGIKNKVVEPLLHGLNVVTTPNGANGLNRLSNLHIAKSAKEFAKVIMSIDKTKTFPLNTKIYKRNDIEDLITFLGRLL